MTRPEAFISFKLRFSSNSVDLSACPTWCEFRIHYSNFGFKTLLQKYYLHKMINLFIIITMGGIRPHYPCICLHNISHAVFDPHIHEDLKKNASIQSINNDFVHDGLNMHSLDPDDLHNIHTNVERSGIESFYKNLGSAWLICNASSTNTCGKTRAPHKSASRVTKSFPYPYYQGQAPFGYIMSTYAAPACAFVHDANTIVFKNPCVQHFHALPNSSTMMQKAILERGKFSNEIVYDGPTFMRSIPYIIRAFYVIDCKNMLSTIHYSTTGCRALSFAKSVEGAKLLRAHFIRVFPHMKFVPLLKYDGTKFYNI